jgi:hypothetical protein
MSTVILSHLLQYRLLSVYVDDCMQVTVTVLKIGNKLPHLHVGYYFCYVYSTPLLQCLKIHGRMVCKPM